MARQNPSCRGQRTLPPGGQDHETAKVPGQPRVCAAISAQAQLDLAVVQAFNRQDDDCAIAALDKTIRHGGEPARVLTPLGWALYKEGDLPPAGDRTARSRKDDDSAPSNGALTARVDAEKRASAKKDGPPPRFVGKELRCRTGGRVVTRPVGRHNVPSYRDV